MNLLARVGAQDRITFSMWRDVEAYEAFRAIASLSQIVGAFDAIYEDGGRPVASGWSILSSGWPRR